MRFAIIGCGRIAPRHIQSIQDLPDAKLVAVADIIASRAKRFSNEYSVDYYNDYRDLLDRKDIDVINVCTPSGLHAQMAIDVMKSGKHVLVEKPMALSLSDADRMIRTANETNQKLCVVLQNRYNPPMQEIRDVVDSGKLGKLFLGNATVRWYRPQSYYEDEWHGTVAMDGGALMNQSIHHIDALQWLMGPIESVFAQTATLAHKMEAEDVGVAVIKFKNGALGTIEGSTLTFPQNLEGSVAIFGERGSLKVGGTALNRKVFWKIEGELEKEREILTQEAVDPPSVYGYSHKAVIEDFIGAITDNRNPQTNGHDARKSVAIVLSIYESARLSKPIDMTNGTWNGYTD